MFCSRDFPSKVIESTPRLRIRAPQTDAGALTRPCDLLEIHARGCVRQTKIIAILLDMLPLSFKTYLPHPLSRKYVIGYIQSLQDSVPSQGHRLLFQHRYEDSLKADSASRYCLTQGGASTIGLSIRSGDPKLLRASTKIGQD